MNEEEIIKLFVVDTFICSTHALQLMRYQMNKHGWTKEEFDKYFEIYTKYVMLTPK